MMVLIGSLAAAVTLGPPALKRSDVVFMYQAPRKTYRDYGATVLAWGGTPTPRALAEAGGVRWFGSVGMVTEFAGYYERAKGSYEDGLCRDIEGKPVKVPWLTDHQHKGVPYWWCCTNQPQMRDYIRQRVIETIKADAEGLHIDDHLGTAGGLWLGVCFCDRCVEGFRTYLAGLPADQRTAVGIADAAAYDFRAEARAWLAAEPGRKVTSHPLWGVWTAYQSRAAAAFMVELRELAQTTAGRQVPVGANAGLLWPMHLADYRALNLFSAETDHHASTRTPSDAPIMAYRMAEAVGRPYAATASGWDWAYVKEHNLHGLVRCWIALSYAAGQMLMAPHRQWCYTDQKGTHWYDGPAERFAPLYRFVRSHAALFDGYGTLADATLVMPNRAFRRDPARWISMGQALTAAGLGYSIALGGDDIVEKPIAAAELRLAPVLVVPDVTALEKDDAARVEARRRSARPGAVLTSVEEAVRTVKPAVAVIAGRPARAFARVKKGSAVVHVVNYDYDAARDDVTVQRDVRVTLDMARLGVARATRCRLVRPGRNDAVLPIVRGTVTVPELDLWALLVVSP